MFSGATDATKWLKLGEECCSWHSARSERPSTENISMAFTEKH